MKPRQQLEAEFDEAAKYALASAFSDGHIHCDEEFCDAWYEDKNNDSTIHKAALTLARGMVEAELEAFYKQTVRMPKPRRYMYHMNPEQLTKMYEDRLEQLRKAG